MSTKKIRVKSVSVLGEFHAVHLTSTFILVVFLTHIMNFIEKEGFILVHSFGEIQLKTLKSIFPLMSVTQI